MALSEIEIVSDSNDQQTSGFRNPNEPAIVDVYAACAYGDFDKLRKFVEVDGVSVYQPDGNGYYALQWAALNNFADIVQYIIEVLLFAFLLNEGRVFNCSFGSQVWCFFICGMCSTGEMSTRPTIRDRLRCIGRQCGDQLQLPMCCCRMVRGSRLLMLMVIG